MFRCLATVVGAQSKSAGGGTLSLSYLCSILSLEACGRGWGGRKGCARNAFGLVLCLLQAIWAMVGKKVTGAQYIQIIDYSQ